MENSEQEYDWREISREVAEWLGEYEYMEGHSTAYMDIMKHAYHAEGAYVWPDYEKDHANFARLLLKLPGTVEITSTGINLRVPDGAIKSPGSLIKAKHRNRMRAALIVSKAAIERGVEPNRIDESEGGEVVTVDSEGRPIHVGDIVESECGYGPDEVIGITRARQHAMLRFKSGGGVSTLYKVVKKRDEK